MTQPIRTIRQGDPGSPGTVNSPLLQLNRGLRQLEQYLADLEAGNFISARRVALGSTTVVGSPVYWNTITSAFEAAQLSVNNTEGLFALADSSKVMGIVIAKETATSGTVMFYGTKNVDITPAIASGSGAGYYYLSTEAGKLTKTRPFVGVPVVFVTNTGAVLMVNRLDDSLDRHTHRKFSLVCLPAGDTVPPNFGDVHVVTNPDANLPGWLPANHASFNGKAPAGAVWGYNLAKDEALNAVWPPIPIESCELIWDTSNYATLGGSTVPLGYGGLCIIDENGLWWTSNCYGDVPWPLVYDSSDNSTSYSDDSNPECPRNRFMSLILHTAWPIFDAATTVVTSLRSVDPRITINCLGTTTPGTKGDLEINLDLSLGVATENSRGAIVLKGLSDSTFSKGVVAEGIYTESNNVILSSDLDPVLLDPEDEDSPLVYQGMVSIEVVPQSTLEIPAQLARLENVLEQYYVDIPYLGMPPGKDSEIRLRFDVPNDLALSSPTFQIRLTLLGRGAGTLPSLTVTGRIVPKAVSSPLSLPVLIDEFAVTIDTTETLAAVNQYISVTSEAFAVAAGDTVFIKVSRDSGDAYTSEVGLLATTGILGSNPP